MARAPRRTDPDLEAGIDLALELFAPLGSLTARKMFGGAGIYGNGRMFALVAGADIYLKTDAVNRAAFDAAGCEPFRWTAPDGRVATMSYARIPDSALDDTEAAATWGRLGLEAALRSVRPEGSRTAQKRLAKLAGEV